LHVNGNHNWPLGIPLALISPAKFDIVQKEGGAMYQYVLAFIVLALVEWLVYQAGGNLLIIPGFAALVVLLWRTTQRSHWVP